MSYNVHLKAENGTVTVHRQSGQVPDGEFEIWGHHGDEQEHLGIQRRDADGRFVSGSQHSHRVATD